MKKPRHWTINGDFIGLKPTGVARYAREVTIALDKLIKCEHPLTKDLDLRLISPLDSEGLPLEAIRTKTLPEMDRPRLPQFWVQAQLPRFVKGGLLSFCNLAPVSVRRHIVCIHDLHTFVMPESYSLGFRLAHRLILPALGRTALKITTVSEFSKQQLVAHGIAPSRKIAVTYNGCDHALRWNSSGSADFCNRQRPFVLYLGQPQKYKNAELIWRIAPDLDRNRVDILVAGNLDTDAIKRLREIVPPNIQLLGRITDAEFAAALKSALCFLFPSRIEGFGLPLAEAMAWGCPVIASNAACMPEIGGEAVLYCDPDDAGAWISKIVKLKSNKCFYEGIKVKSINRSNIYSWENVALVYLNLMSEIDR